VQYTGRRTVGRTHARSESSVERAATRRHRGLVGNIIEWYDFYIFGSLASILAVKFFEKERWALLYPIVVPAVMFVLAVFLMPETRTHSIWEEGAIEATRRASRA
jgi:hypothetical protein